MDLDLPILSFLIWLPIFAAVIVLWLGSLNQAEVGKSVALAASLFTFAASILLYTGFDATTANMQFVERVAWIERFRACLLYTSPSPRDS